MLITGRSWQILALNSMVSVQFEVSRENEATPSWSVVSVFTASLMNK